VNEQDLETLISECLNNFYKNRLKAIQDLKLIDVLSRKNPYLFRAIGTENASEIVEHILRAHLSSSDETIFGNEFFEPIARIASGGKTSIGAGIDVVIETDTKVMAIAVKSGGNWGNADQHKKLNSRFMEVRNRLYKINKSFDAVIGHGYGTKKRDPSPERIYRDISGQTFWTEITGDPDFYLKLVRMMKDEPQKHKAEFQSGWYATINKFTQQFISNFCHPDFTIDWEKLTKLNSGGTIH